MARLTAKSVEHIKPGSDRKEIPDSGCTGLYLVSQPSGVKSFAIRYRHAGKPVKLTLGKWPALSLHDARAAAAEAFQQLAKGADPAAARRAEKIAAMEADAHTVAAVCSNFMAREGRKLRSAGSRESIFKRLVYPAIGDRPINEVRRSEIVHLLDKIEDRNGPVMADVTLAVLRRAFRWHALRDDSFNSPIVAGMARTSTKERARSRVLDDTELGKLWKATADGTQFSSLVRALLLTGARRNEIAAISRDEISADGLWILPASRSKTKVEVMRPLSKAVRGILDEQPQIDDSSYIFSTGVGTPLRTFSKAKRALDLASGTSNWTLHDLRRSARSLLSRAGVNVDVAERVLGHAIPGVRGTYDRHKYLVEMEHALEALSSLVERIVAPPTAVAHITEARTRRRRA
jgi:integrase